MLKRLVVGGVSVFAGLALIVACSSASKKPASGGSSGSAGSGGSSGAGGSATGGSGGSMDGGVTDASGDAPPYADANLDAPYELPDGGCGQVFCPAAVGAHCSKSFQSLNDCATFCTNVEQSKCSSDLNTLLTCAGANPNIQCDSNGQISFPDCTSQAQAFGTCYASLSDGGT